MVKWGLGRCDRLEVTMTTKRGHSAGPWRRIPAGQCADPQSDWQVVDSAGSFVCRVDRHKRGQLDPVNTVNASLIAAAPALLAALEEALAQLKNDHNAESCPAVVAARIALRLAVGE